MLNRSYLIVCEKTREAALVDAAWEMESLLNAIQAENADLRFLLCTHGHDDHVNLVPDLLEKFPAAKAVCHEKERIPAPKLRTLQVTDGTEISVGSIQIRCMHTPGHTPGSVTYLAGCRSSDIPVTLGTGPSMAGGEYAFFGDTLFCGEDCGRVDFYRDGPKEMVASLQRIRDLPDELIACSGHKYGAYETTTMAFEKKHNRALQCRTLDEFLNFKGR